MKLRVARHTDRLEEVVAFYRDGLGLPELGKFADHDGYDGVFIDVPGTGSHLKFTSGARRQAPQPDPESLLVLYLGSEEELEVIAARVAAREVVPENPYWRRNARAFADPDGFQVLLMLQREASAEHPVEVIRL